MLLIKIVILFVTSDIKTVRTLGYFKQVISDSDDIVHRESINFTRNEYILHADILLTDLVKLLHLKIYFSKDTLLDNLCLRDYVIEKRHQAFPTNSCNEDEVTEKCNKS
jgi:hypothetical protein